MVIGRNLRDRIRIFLKKKKEKSFLSEVAPLQGDYRVNETKKARKEREWAEWEAQEKERKATASSSRKHAAQSIAKFY